VGIALLRIALFGVALGYCAIQRRWRLLPRYCASLYPASLSLRHPARLRARLCDGAIAWPAFT